MISLLKSISDEDHNFNKYSHRDIDLLKIPYDFDSIMHYGRKSFSKNGKDTIRSILDPNRVLGQRDGFTGFDVHEINALYDCAGKMTWLMCNTTPIGYFQVAFAFVSRRVLVQFDLNDY